ncbi:MAG: RimJ/RimL family protein N-acetyltransferase [Candidatus Azotimanducaceae bacterium]
MAWRTIGLSAFRKRYPKVVNCQGEEFELNVVDSLDIEIVQAFTDQLPEHDLMFLSRDIRQKKVVEAWSRSLGTGEIVTIAAMRGEEIVGTTAIVLDKLSWSAHVGELRILITPEAREVGLGRTLIQESFLIGLDLALEKLTVSMLLDQERAITVFEEMGFRTEAMFRDHLKDGEGNKHDLLIMSHDVAGVQSRMQAYGLDQAL